MIQLPPQLVSAVEYALSANEGPAVSIITAHSLAGGCINSAAALQTNDKKYFLKWNDEAKYPGMFEAEARGLRLLASPGAFYIPNVIGCGAAGSNAFLLLEFIEAGKQEESFWDDFGRSMAKMHRVTQEKFGLEQDNYIGSLVQSNKQHDSWAEFFIHERLMPQLKLARDAGKISSAIAESFERLFPKLDDIFPQEPPALLHGDLWSGNYMISPRGTPCIYDPAVYFGHREMDIAMTRLFGGFQPAMYPAYNSELPLEKGWENRVDICNLYPLMVHVNLFGGSYLSDVKAVISRF
jgi:protein-ribulosamine 3-kinase